MAIHLPALILFLAMIFRFGEAAPQLVEVFPTFVPALSSTTITLIGTNLVLGGTVVVSQNVGDPSTDLVCAYDVASCPRVSIATTAVLPGWASSSGCATTEVMAITFDARKFPVSSTVPLRVSFVAKSGQVFNDQQSYNMRNRVVYVGNFTKMITVDLVFGTQLRQNDFFNIQAMGRQLLEGATLYEDEFPVFVYRPVPSELISRLNGSRCQVGENATISTKLKLYVLLPDPTAVQDSLVGFTLSSETPSLFAEYGLLTSGFSLDSSDPGTNVFSGTTQVLSTTSADDAADPPPDESDGSTTVQTKAFVIGVSVMAILMFIFFSAFIFVYLRKRHLAKNVKVVNVEETSSDFLKSWTQSPVFRIPPIHVVPPSPMSMQWPQCESRDSLCTLSGEDVSVDSIMLGDVIGKGNFGTVHVGLQKETGLMYAVKVIPLSESDIGSLRTEVSTMVSLDHPNIVRYFGMWEDPERNTASIVMEYISGGSLASILQRYGPMAESLARNYTRSFLLGLCYLHDNKISHRDIKPENILLSPDGVVKLADFGTLHVIANGSATTAGTGDIKGTPIYMAPEIMRQGNVGRKADVWSVGCTVLHLVTGERPWASLKLTLHALLFRIGTTETGPDWTRSMFSEELNEFLDKCFVVNVPDRASSEQLAKLDWITDTYLTPLTPSIEDENRPAEYAVENPMKMPRRMRLVCASAPHPKDI